MLTVCLHLTHSMFNDGCSPSTMEKPSDTEQMTSFCSAVYPRVIFCESGQVELVLLLSSGVFFLLSFGGVGMG